LCSPECLCRGAPRDLDKALEIAPDDGIVPRGRFRIDNRAQRSVQVVARERIGESTMNRVDIRPRGHG
jgi:hypothetical protein